MNRIQCTVRGRVQSVGFRYWTQKKAITLGLHGWVKNCNNGTVQLEACGPKETLIEFVDALHKGPLLSNVTHVECKAIEPSDAIEENFQITY